MKKWLIIICSSLIFSCSYENMDRYEDGFYNISNCREKCIPLLKPYIAENLTSESWQIILNTYQIPCDHIIDHVDSINVIDSNIYVVKLDSKYGGCSDSTKMHYFILGKIGELAFQDRKSFLKCLSEKNLVYKPLYEINSIWSFYSKTGYLKWSFLEAIKM